MSSEMTENNNNNNNISQNPIIFWNSNTAVNDQEDELNEENMTWLANLEPRERLNLCRTYFERYVARQTNEHADVSDRINYVVDPKKRGKEMVLDISLGSTAKDFATLCDYFTANFSTITIIRSRPLSPAEMSETKFLPGAIFTCTVDSVIQSLPNEFLTQVRTGEEEMVTECCLSSCSII